MQLLCNISHVKLIDYSDKQGQYVLVSCTTVDIYYPSWHPDLLFLKFEHLVLKMFNSIVKPIKSWLITIDHLFGHTGSKLRKNRDIALLAAYIGWMSFFVVKFWIFLKIQKIAIKKFSSISTKN